MINLAGVLHDQKKNEEAEQMYREGLYIRKNQLGENHLSSAKAMHKFALLLQDIGKNDEAKQLLIHSLRNI